MWLLVSLESGLFADQVSDAGVNVLGMLLRICQTIDLAIMSFVRVERVEEASGKDDRCDRNLGP